MIREGDAACKHGYRVREDDPSVQECIDREATATTPQERVVDEARHLLSRLDEGRIAYAKEAGMVARIDFAIGATLHLRALVKEYDEAVGRG